jgi:hypothetical protein
MYCYETSRDIWRGPRPTHGCSASKEPDMVMIIKRRPEWLGYVVRMEIKQRWERKKIESKPEDSLRWLENVENDLRELKMKRWSQNK